MTVSKDAAGAPAPPPTESEDLEKAKKVLAVWLASQNAADFDAYKELYGKGFRGVRMSTDKRVDLDRDAWLKDRARMFSKRMVVTAEDVRFSRADEASTIDFVQTWKSGTFADVGEKRLVLRPEAGELRIVSEEMLTSERLKPEAGISVSHLYPRRAARQFKVGLGKSAASPTFAHRGKPNAIVVSEGEGRWATKRVDHIEREVIAASLPHALRELAGRSLEVFGPRGKVCDTKVESFREVRKPTALSMVIKRRKTMRDSGDHDALASELWPDLPQGKLVVEVAGCDGLWARTPSSSPPLFGVEQSSEELTKLARQGLLKSKAFAEAALEGEAKWELEHEGESEDQRAEFLVEWTEGFAIDIKVFGKRSKAPSLVVLTWKAGERLLFGVDGAELVPLDLGADGCRGPAKSIVDINGDGTLDILSSVEGSTEVCPAVRRGSRLEALESTRD